MPDRSKIFTAFVLFFLSSISVFAQWTVVPSGTTSNLNGAFLLDSGVGFAVGDAGRILKTTDAGMTWATLASGTTSNLYDVYFFADAEGVAVGDNGLILRTTDGGASWLTIASGVRDSLRAVSFSGANGICGGTSQDILYSTDSGASWHVSQEGFFGGGFFGAHMLSPTLGFVAGQNSIFQGFLGTTVDGGVNWTFKFFYFDGNEGSCDDVFFFDDSTGLTSGVLFDGRGALARTTNGGGTWNTTLFAQSVRGIDFPTAANGFAVGGGGTILHSTDAGITWSAQSSGTSVDLMDVHFATDGERGIAVGAAGTIVRTSNGGGGGDEFALVGAASRKGPFEIDLSLDGPLGIECRTRASRHNTIVCRFNHPVTAVDEVTTSCGAVATVRIDEADPTQVVLDVSSEQCNAQVVTLTLSGVHDDQSGIIPSASIEMGVLLGDANGDGLVDEADLREIKLARGETTDSGNFRDDLNANGHVDPTDVRLARAALGTMLPP